MYTCTMWQVWWPCQLRTEVETRASDALSRDSHGAARFTGAWIFGRRARLCAGLLPLGGRHSPGLARVLLAASMHTLRRYFVVVA